MPLVDTIDADYKQALTSRDQARVDLLRLLRSALKNETINLKKSDLTDEEATKVLKKEAKKRTDAIELYRQGGRKDLADKEQQELNIIQEYLPAAMSEDEIKRVVAEAVASLPEVDPSQFGMVMKLVMPKIQGRADGQAVSQAVKEILQQSDVK